MNDTEVQIIVQATQKGFDAVTKAINELGNNLAKAFEKTPAQVGRLNAETVKVTSSINTLTSSVAQLNQKLSDDKPIGVFKNMSWSIKSIVDDMEKLIQIQVRWYATRLVLWETANALKAVAVETMKYAAAIDQARGEMLRWEASSGRLSATVIKDTDAILKAVRMATTEYPVKMEELSKSVQAFIGAGLPYDMVKDMVSTIAALKTGFPEIDFEMFAVAATGAYKVFKDTITGVNTEAEKMKVIFDSISAAQATGIIRPEQFTKVLAYLSQITQLAGFSLNEMLALSVAVTDTGIQAASAARLIGGVISSIQKEQFAKGMKVYFDLEIKPNVPIEKQFQEIFGRIKEKVGDVITPAWARVFEQMGIPQDRLKVFETLIQRVDEFANTLKKLEGARGGVDLAAKVASAPVGKQWEVFVATMREFSKTAVDTLPIMQSFMNVILEFGRGLLVASDKTGEYAKKFGELSEVARFGFDTFNTLKNVIGEFKAVFDSLITIFKPFISLVLSLVSVLEKNSEVLKLLVDFYIAKWIISLLGLVAGTGPLVRLSTLLGTVFLQLSKWLINVPLLSNALISLTNTFEKHISVVGGIGTIYAVGFGAALFVVNQFFDRLNDRMDEVEAAQKRISDNFSNLIKNATTSLQAAEVAGTALAERETLRYLKNFGDRAVNAITGRITVSAKIGGKYFSKDIEELDAEINQLDFDIARAQRHLTNLVKTEGESKKKANIPTIPPPTPEKATVTDTTSDIASNYKSMISEIKDKYHTLIADEQAAFSTGKTNAKDYFDNVKKFAVDSYNEESKVLAEWQSKTISAYQKMKDQIEAKYKGKPQLNEELSKSNRGFEAALGQISKTASEAQRRRDDIIRAAEVASIKAEGDAALAVIREQMKESSFLREEEIKDFKSNLDIQMMLLNDRYDRGLVSAKEYYSTLRKLYEDDTNSQIKKLEEDFNNFVNELGFQREYLEKAGLKADAEALGNKALEEYRRNQSVINALKRRAAEEGIKITLEEAASYKAIWEGKGGIVGVWEKALEIMGRDFTNWGKQIGLFFEDIIKEMATTFETFFIDVFEGNLKSVSAYFRSFAEEVYRSMAKILSQQVAMATASGIYGLGKIAGNYIGGMFGSGGTTAGFHQGGIIPEFHAGGLMNDERIAKVKVGERVLSQEQNKMFEQMYSSMSKSGLNNVQFNLYNQSGQPLSGSASPPEFDGQKWVINAVIKDYNEGGPTRMMFGGR